MAKMKIKPAHYQFLHDLIVRGEIIHCHQDYCELGLSTGRWMWDCVWEIPQGYRNQFFDEVYQYANDTHIETALRKICQPHRLDKQEYAK